jgi:hypothetical protein
MRSALAIAATCLALGACAGTGQHYALGYGIANGAALLPPTASRGTTAMINYHEEAGVVARTIILVMVAMSLKNPEGDTSTSSKSESERVGDTIYTTTTTTTTFTPTTPEERARREEAIRDFNETVAPGIIHDALPVTLDMGWARPSLGGDTRGFTFDMMYQVPFAQTTALAFGFGYRTFTFHDRSVANVTVDGSTARSMRTTGPIDYEFIGFPIRFTQGIAPRTSAYLQWDLNIRALTDDYASPITLGITYKLPVISFHATTVMDRLDPREMTFGIEGVVGF